MPGRMGRVGRAVSVVGALPKAAAVSSAEIVLRSRPLHAQTAMARDESGQADGFQGFPDSSCYFAKMIPAMQRRHDWTRTWLVRIISIM